MTDLKTERMRQGEYFDIRDYILTLDDDITMKPTKLYIGFLYHNHNLVDIKLQKNSIIVWLNTQYGKLNDPMKMISDVTHKGHHGNGGCQIKCCSGRENMGYVKRLDFVALPESNVRE